MSIPLLSQNVQPTRSISNYGNSRELPEPHDVDSRLESSMSHLALLPGLQACQATNVADAMDLIGLAS